MALISEVTVGDLRVASASAPAGVFPAPPLTVSLTPASRSWRANADAAKAGGSAW